jgi:flagellar protein FlbB
VSVASAFANLIKVFFLVVLIIAITLGGIYWFDYLGIVDYNRLIQPVQKHLPAFMRRGEAVTDDQFLLDKEFIRKQQEMMDERERELDLARADLETRDLALKELEAKLGEEAKRLEEEKKVLSEKIGAYDNYKDNVRKQAQYFTSMPPKAAVDRLAKLDELLAIDILRQIDRTAEEQGKASIVPYFLSLMDPEKAASIQRKMTKMGGQEG